MTDGTVRAAPAASRSGRAGDQGSVEDGGGRRRRKVSRDDVARRAGISTAVVSYVLNDGPRAVAPATRARVEEAIRDLGYRPDRVARALAARRSDTLGLVVADLSNPFLGDLSRAIETTAYDRGLTVLLANAGVDHGRERRQIEQLLDRRVDGLVIVPVGLDRTTIEELNASGRPVAVVDRPVRGLDATTVLVDNAAGARAATRHLLDHGHRRVACIAGPAPLWPASERLRGWRSVIAGAGLDPGSCPVLRTSVSRRAGYEAGAALLERPAPPTAVFVTSDEQAIGVLRAVADLGRRVPDDLAVAAFDGIAHGAFCVPGLTTARQPVDEMGRRAVTALAGDGGDAVTEVLAVDLVRRGSCGCPDTIESRVADPAPGPPLRRARRRKTAAGTVSPGGNTGPAGREA